VAAHTETFNDRTIQIDEAGNLHVAGKEIHYEHDRVSNTWSARYLPYTRYDSLLELARAIIRDTSEFVDLQP
jgi:hypothetical protein